MAREFYNASRNLMKYDIRLHKQRTQIKLERKIVKQTEFAELTRREMRWFDIEKGFDKNDRKIKIDKK